MKFNHYIECLFDNGFRELGYFSGIRVFLGTDLLITIEEYPGGLQVTFDSTVRNIGEVYYVSSDHQLCQLLGEYL